MGEQRYKVGDWVRVKDNRGASLDYKVGDVGQVSSIREDLVFFEGKPGMFDYRFEPWQPRVGERVRTIGGGDVQYIGVEGYIEADDGAIDRNLSIKLDKPIEKWGDTKIWRSARHLEPILDTPVNLELITPTTTIVAFIENGQPKPSSTPQVHTSAEAAEKEAKRLAAKNKGKQFGVFTLTATHEVAEPVYDHKWQNLAVLGLKIDAIKELRSFASLDLVSAKRAVEVFIDKAA